MSDTALPRPPEVLDGFRIGALRRSSGALAVHAATDRLDLAVEIHLVKESALPPGFPASAFTAALRRAADVRHESILPYVTGGRADGLIFAVAKTVDGAGLDEVLSRGGALAGDRVLAIGAAIAGVLATLERAGLRHADLTPRRVLLPGRGQVAVGPPRLLPAEVAPRNERYLSPEEARGEAGDIRSDLFVLGLLLAEAATGGPLLKGPASEVKRVLATGQLPPLGGDVAPALRSVLARLLAADPTNRFASAAAAERALSDATRFDTAPISIASIPVADAAPETAPIPRDLAAQVQAAAAQQRLGATPPPLSIAPVPIVPDPAPPEGADPSAIKRPPGRLYLQARLGESMLEIDENVYVGRPAGAIDLHARPEAFPEAAFLVERDVEVDRLRALTTEVRVNGQPVRTHELKQGDAIVAGQVNGRYERAARMALRATGAGGGPPPNPNPRRFVLAGACLIALAGILISLPKFTGARTAADEADAAARAAERALSAERPADRPAAGSGTTAGPATREQAARDAYDAAKEWQRKNPQDIAGLTEKLSGVVDRYGETGHGAIARTEIAEAQRRGRGAGGGEFDRLVATAKTDAAEGRLDDALGHLRAYAGSHTGTIVGERAEAAAVQLENEITGRFEADAIRIERALSDKDWAGAFRLLSSMMDYAPRTLRDRAQDLRRRAEAGRDGVDPATLPKTPPSTPVVPPVAPPKGPDEPKSPETPPTGSGDRDKDAETAFRAAKRLMESGKEPEAIDAFMAFLREYKDTKPGAKYDVEARSRITALAQGPAGVTKLFRGKCEKLDKSRWRVTFDFANAEELKDFRDVEAFEAPPRAEWKLADGAVRAKGSGAFVLDATFQIDQLVTTVTVSPERAHDLGVAFLDASEPKRFFLYTLQNTFFTLGKGDAAKVFEENAIVLFGPNMWRDTPPGQLGFVRKCGSPEPTIRPGESSTIKCGKSDAQVWMRMEGGKQISGAAYGDVKLEFQGIEPAVFVLNSSGAFDDFVVEGTPDPEWVTKRWRAILSGL
ncbi:MAG: hypothetical protein K8T90_10210 [Planctomycetes bacterium]|nr:hypothetical protein [Planctomycetota bacterium]